MTDDTARVGSRRPPADYPSAAFVDERPELGLRVWTQGPLFVVRWSSMMTADSGDHLVTAIARMPLPREHRHYIAIQPAHILGMSGEDTIVAVRYATAVLRSVATFQLLVLGDGVGATLLRSSFRVLLTTARTTGALLGRSTGNLVDRVFLTPNIAQALSRVHSYERGLDVSTSLRALQDAGMLD